MRTKAVVDSHIRISDVLPSSISNRIIANLTFRNPAAGFKAYRGWKITEEELEPIKGYRKRHGKLILPRGYLEQLFQYVRLDEWLDKTTWHKPHPIKNTIDLYPHQRKPIKIMAPIDTGMLQAPCGSGKSIMALKLICDWGQPTLVLAHTNQIMDQWCEYVEQFTGLKAGIIRGNTFDIQQITIGSVMTLANRVLDSDFRRYFGVVILDEAHHAPAYSFQSVLTRFASRKRIGISATPRREDGLQGYLVAVAGPVRAKVDPEELIQTGFTLRPTVYKVHTQFKVKPWEAAREERLYAALEDNKNRAIDVAKVAYANKDRRVLVLSRRIAHLDHIYDRLYDMDPTVKAKVLTGRLTKEERRDIVDGLRKGRYRIVLATQLADEGLDIPRLDTILLSFPSSSALKLEQQIGRIMRKHKKKKDARIYDFIDEKVPKLLKQAMRRMQFYRGRKYPFATGTLPALHS